MIYKLSRLSREEIQSMLQVHDIRETRVYQEAREEGREEGLHEGIEKERQRSQQEKLHAVSKLAALQISPAKIADVLGLDLELVLKTMGK